MKNLLHEFHLFLESLKNEYLNLPENDTENARLAHELMERQHQKRLKQRVAKLHAAEIAYILEGLNLQDRLAVWKLIPKKMAGPILMELSFAVRETLIAAMEVKQVVTAAKILEIDKIARLAKSLPEEAVDQILQGQSEEARRRLEAALSYQQDTVGALMDFSMIKVREDNSIETVLRYCRLLGQLPEHTNQIFVVDRDNVLKGRLQLEDLVSAPFNAKVQAVMSKAIISFKTDDSAEQASNIFDRYELISAPVVDDQDHLMGRLCVDDILDFIRVNAEKDLLAQVGLRAEDLFSGIWQAAKNRWLWLVINMLTAFIATRVISVFEGTIAELVALATLMPIVAATGGNTGNQTSMLIIRSIALGQVTPTNIKALFLKELGISLVNGLIWGGLMGLFVSSIYGNTTLGWVMAVALLLNMMVATFTGIVLPVIRDHFNLDPAMGVSVIITFLADSFGFFIFLGLAALVL